MEKSKLTQAGHLIKCDKKIVNYVASHGRLCGKLCHFLSLFVGVTIGYRVENYLLHG